MALAETATLLVKLTMQDELSPKLATGKSLVSDFGKTLLSVGGAAGFGALAAGALSAQEAQGKFMAATGQSRDAAKEFVSGMDSLAGSAGAVGMSFDDIAATGTKVAQQFGTTGQATTDLTEQVLEFSKATGQDATQAAADLEDTLSAYGLSADDAAGFTDQLVASSQKYGTEVGPEQLQVLRNISPAIQAMGGNIDDATGLLNVFEVAGLDASKAQLGLNTAISKLPPGQSLNDFVKHLSDLKAQGIDPTSEAIKIFGTRAGPALAAAIQPGMQGLSDLAVSADEAKGATNKAADAMLTDADKIRGVADKIVAGAREIGQDFGPALTGLASLGSLTAPLVGKFGDLIKNVAAKILPTAAAQGAVIGAAEGEAEVEAATGTSMIQKWLAKFGLGTAAKVAAATAAGEAEGAAEGEAAAEASAGPKAIASAGAAGGLLGGALGVGLLGAAGAAVINLPQILDHLTGQDTTSKLANIGKTWADATLSSLSTEAQQGAAKAFQDAFNAAQASGATTDAAAKAGVDAGNAFLEGMGAGIVNEQGQLVKPAAEAGQTAGDAFGQAIGVGAQDHIDEAAAAAAKIAAQQAADYKSTVERNRNALSLWEITRNQQEADAQKWQDLWDHSARAITGNLVQTLKGTKDDVKSAMADLTFAINHPLDLEKEEARIKGALASKELQKGLASSNPLIRTQAEQTKQHLIDLMAQIDPNWKYEADKASTDFRDNLNNGYPGAIAQARRVVQDLNAQLNDLKTNYHINISTGINRYGDVGRRAGGGDVAKGRAYIVGEERPELFIPDENGRIVPNVPPLSQLHGLQASTQAIAVTVNLSTREFNQQEQHYAVIQAGRTPFYQ